jgi:hypothetical protein
MPNVGTEFFYYGEEYGSMAWLWIAAFAAVTVVVLASSVRVRIHVIREVENDHMSFQITALFGLVRYKVEIPYINFTGLRELDFKSERSNLTATDLVAKDRTKISLEKIIDRFQKLNILIHHVVGFDEWLTGTLSHIRCTELQWNTRIGIGDAADTAVSVGVLWGLKTNLLGFLFKYLTLDAETKPKLSVDPQFNRTHFSTMMMCIVRVRLGYAILAGLLFLVRIMRMKGGTKTWQSILFKA